MNKPRYMVCKKCLHKEHGGAEKACGHGWDILRGKPVERACSLCGEVGPVSCPDGGEK